MHHETVNPELFKWNRKRFAREMKEDSVAIFQSNDLVDSNGNAQCRFRQNPDLYYLTGVTQPDTVLLLAPGTAKQGFSEVLFIRRPDHRDTRLRGPGLQPQQAAQISGIQQVCFVDELEEILHELVLLASRVYVNSREDRNAYSEAPARDLRFAERLMKLYPAHKYHRAQPILKKIGMAKSAPEVGLIRKGISIANTALQQAAKQISVDVAEHVVEAAGMQAIIGGGAQGVAHPFAVAAGRRSLYPAYSDNAGVLSKNDIVQLQIGVTYAGYQASIARVIPVSEHFSETQVKCYLAVEKALKASWEALVPGVTLPELETLAQKTLQDACEALGVKRPSIGVDFSARTYHHIGRNLRDPYNAYTPLQSGMIITCQPAIYLHQKGIGMQLRDVILVTDEGPINLTADVAKSLTEVEQLKGILA